jgi:signal transduction histidine kinase
MALRFEVEAAQAGVQLQSEPGSGTLFTVRLPLPLAAALTG